MGILWLMKEKRASLMDYLEVTIAWRKFIIRNIIIITLAAILVSFLLVKKYTAAATMLPPSTGPARPGNRWIARRNE